MFDILIYSKWIFFSKSTSTFGHYSAFKQRVNGGSVHLIDGLEAMGLGSEDISREQCHVYTRTRPDDDETERSSVTILQQRVENDIDMGK